MVGPSRRPGRLHRTDQARRYQLDPAFHRRGILSWIRARTADPPADSHHRRNRLGRKRHGDAESVLGTRSGCKDVAHPKPAAADGPAGSLGGPLVRNRALGRRHHLPLAAGECIVRRAGCSYLAQLLISLHTTQNTHTDVHLGGFVPGRYPAADWLGGGARFAHHDGMGPLWNIVSLAVSAFLFHRMVVPG